MSAAISYGPRWGLLNNASIGQQYYDQLRLVLQNLDTLLYTNVKNTTTVVPPSSPNNGDAYLLLSTPSGAWMGRQYQVAWYDAQLTSSGSNTLAPGWQFIVPSPGYLVFSIADNGFYLFNGANWAPFGVNTNTLVTNPVTDQTVNQPSGTSFEIVGGSTVINSALTFPSTYYDGDATLATTVLNFVDASSGAFTLTIPFPPAGTFYSICREDASPNTNIVSITPAVGLIDGAASLPLAYGQSVIIGYGGSNWYTLSNSPTISPGLIQARNLGSATAITAESGLGAGGSAALATGSTDLAGAIVLSSGVSPSANALLATVTFGTAYPSANYWIAMSNTSALAATVPIYIANKTTAGFDVYSSVNAMADTSTYGYDYHIIQGAS